jgi:hypothetical protein
VLHCSFRSGGGDGQIIIWNASNYTSIRKVNAHRKVVTVIQKVGFEVYTASAPAMEVKIWNRLDFTMIHEIKLTSARVSEIAPFFDTVLIGSRGVPLLNEYKFGVSILLAALWMTFLFLIVRVLFF